MTRPSLAVLVPVTLVLFLSPLLRGDEAAKGDKVLDGDWRVQSCLTDGKEEPVALGDIILTFRGNVMIGTAALKWTTPPFVQSTKGAVTINARMTPKTMDFLADGNAPDAACPAIYEIKDDVLLLCRAEAGKERPTEFSSKPGSGRMLLTLKRVKK